MSSPAADIPASGALQRSPSRWGLWGAFAVIYLVWGSTFLGIRVAVETLPPLSMAAIRFLVSGGILLLVSSRVRPRPTLRQWGNAAIVGALFFLGNHGLVSTAARFIPSSLACLIVATEVPIIALLSSALLPDQPLTRSGLIGAGLGLAGVVCLFSGSGAGEGAASMLACLAVLGASLSWSIGAVLSQRLQFPSDPILRAAMQMTWGGVLLSGASLLRGEPAALGTAAFSGRSLIALLYLIAFGSVLAFACYSYLLKHVRADTGGHPRVREPAGGSGARDLAGRRAAAPGPLRVRAVHPGVGQRDHAGSAADRRSTEDRAIRCGSEAPDRARFALPGYIGVATIDPGPGESAFRTEGVVTVKTLKFWISPAALIALWIIAAAFTLSQLATVAPLLLSTRVQPPPLEEPRQLGA